MCHRMCDFADHKLLNAHFEKGLKIFVTQARMTSKFVLVLLPQRCVSLKDFSWNLNHKTFYKIDFNKMIQVFFIILEYMYESLSNWFDQENQDSKIVRKIRLSDGKTTLKCT